MHDYAFLQVLQPFLFPGPSAAAKTPSAVEQSAKHCVNIAGNKVRQTFAQKRPQSAVVPRGVKTYGLLAVLAFFTLVTPIAYSIPLEYAWGDDEAFSHSYRFVQIPLYGVKNPRRITRAIDQEYV